MEDNRYTYPNGIAIFEKSLSFIPPELIDEQSRSKLINFIRLLPPTFMVPHMKALGFECSLNAKKNWCDLPFYYDLLNPLFHDISQLPKSWQGCPGWQKLAYFSKECIGKNLFSGELQEKSDGVWIEFDVGSSLSAPHKPNFFLIMPRVPKENFCNALAASSSLFEIPDATLRLLQKCNDALVDDWSIIHLGFMISRKRNGYKLVVKGEKLKSKNVETYLLRLGILDYHPNLMKIFKSMESYLENVILSIDIVDDQLSPKIGLELLIPSGPNRNERWKQCLENINVPSAIDNAKLLKCFEWCGYDREFIGNSMHLPHFFLISQRFISHFKLVFSPGKGIEAKVYLQSEWGLDEKADQQDVFEFSLPQSKQAGFTPDS